ncbi:hypothetical protein GCM10025857_32180 [Alicyclobacillus contaminans]|nr:hypothetical protein GCM10025857_32180 [Alicyclobacillus contaminans]
MSNGRMRTNILSFVCVTSCPHGMFCSLRRVYPTLLRVMVAAPRHPEFAPPSAHEPADWDGAHCPRSNISYKRRRASAMPWLRPRG